MKWSKEELDLLTKMYGEEGHKVKELMKVFNRSEPSIRKKVRELNLKSPLQQKERNGLYYCAKCKEYKPKELFGVNKNNKYNIRTYCLSCEKQYIKKLKDKKLLEKSY